MEPHDTSGKKINLKETLSIFPFIIRICLTVLPVEKQ